MFSIFVFFSPCVKSYHPVMFVSIMHEHQQQQQWQLVFFCYISENKKKSKWEKKIHTNMYH